MNNPSITVQEAAGKRSRLLLDTSDLTISQYSLLGPTPPRSAPGSPATATRDPPSAAPSAGREGGETVPAEVPPKSDPDHSSGPESTGEARGGNQPDPDAPSETAGSAPTTPDVAFRQEVGSAATAGPGEPIPECPDPPMSTLSTDVIAECAQSAASGNPPPPDLSTVDGETEDPPTQEVVASDAAADSWDPTPDCPDPPMSTLSSDGPAAQRDQSAAPESSPLPDLSTSGGETEDPLSQEVGSPDVPADPSDPTLDGPDPPMSTLSSLQSTDVPADQSAAPESSLPPDLSTSGGETEGPPAQDPHPPSAPCLHCPMKISLGSLREAISCSSIPQTLSHSDRAVYLIGGMKDSWEEERCESVAELPLDSVAIIRDLVTEITEVETVISPRPNSGHTA
ncbi:vegetative cell wall protein gp1-like [Notothenia coriiceps]|uniref:Vegetative cell wall protein gp1-like n=1 Tax=Notothenia coriiceps TaxID=8208 RepID=A0A6I9P7L4_9TELE|nr:PREDICTED: vegetative cell wall protein gp1-like [Notothenia coriiceps]